MNARLRRLVRQPGLLFLLASSASVWVYLGSSAAGGSFGFPLDDAWIHQTFARNLGLYGEFSFMRGQPSAGSTAPLWTAILALGYLARIDPLVWTYALGTLLLALNAWLVYRLVLRWWPGTSAAAVLSGLFVTLEWHLAWSAGSGMETLLFSACTLAVCVFDWPSQAGLAGLVTGLAVLTRPDGLSLGLILAARACLSSQRSWRSILMAAVGFGVLFVPYLWFNVALSGSPWPNTFYAKQAEYAILRDQPLWTRLATVSLLPLIGGLASLVPAIIVTAWQAGRSRRWEVPIALGWVLALMAAYALRLPVTYQHGRYLMPVIPVLLAVGVGGLATIVRPRSVRFLPRILSRAWLAATALLAVIFWLRGVLAYRTDVRIIQTEMVATAHWVEVNTPPDALIAAHDIGALGYFGGRRVLDMAGLVSPQVIPFIRDERRLGDWLDQEDASYLVTFPGWYPSLSTSGQAERAFMTEAPFSPAEGGENMAVYIWRDKR